MTWCILDSEQSMMREGGCKIKTVRMVAWAEPQHIHNSHLCYTLRRVFIMYNTFSRPQLEQPGGVCTGIGDGTPKRWVSPAVVTAWLLPSIAFLPFKERDGHTRQSWRSRCTIAVDLRGLRFPFETLSWWCDHWRWARWFKRYQHALKRGETSYIIRLVIVDDLDSGQGEPKDEEFSVSRVMLQEATARWDWYSPMSSVNSDRRGIFR